MSVQKILGIPDAPTPPPPPPPPPSANPGLDPSRGQASNAEDARRKRVAQGAASTILTGPQGLDAGSYSSSLASQTLLGS